MKTRKFKPAYLLAALPLAFASGTALTFNQTEGDNQSEEKAEATETSRAVDLIELADRLAAFAVDRGDAAMLVQAARLKAGISTQDGAAAAEGGEVDGDKDGGIDFSVVGLLDHAEVLAHGNDALLAMVAEARTEAARTRGRVGGPARSVARVQAGGRTTFRGVNFHGAEPARVWLVGDGDTDLDLYVYDQNGNRICASLGAWDRESCAWTPRWTGAFTIEVRNLGSVWNQFVLTTN